MLKKDVLEYFGNLPEDPKVIRHRRPGPDIGAVRKTAIALGCTVQNVYSWKDHVPENIAYKIHHLTKGKVKL